MNKKTVVVGVVIFTLISIFLKYAQEHHIESSEIAGIDAIMINELKALGFPKNFEIVEFRLSNQSNKNRELYCVIKSEEFGNVNFYDRKIIKNGNYTKIEDDYYKKGDIEYFFEEKNNSCKIRILKNI